MSAAGIAAELELRGHFSGRRSGKRSEVQLDVELQGLKGRFKARVVDISRTGVLIEVTDHEFATLHEERDLMRYGEKVQGQFGLGMLIHVVGKAVRLKATVARITMSQEDDARVLIACKFRMPLTPEICGLLEVEFAEDQAD